MAYGYQATIIHTDPTTSIQRIQTLELTVTARSACEEVREALAAGCNLRSGDLDINQLFDIVDGEGAGVSFPIAMIEAARVDHRTNTVNGREIQASTCDSLKYIRQTIRDARTAGGGGPVSLFIDTY